MADTIKKRSTVWSNVKALFFGLVVALVLIEIILRIFQPFPFRVKHGHLILPANQKMVKDNPHSKKLERKIYYSRNSLGMRGAELPKDTTGIIKIITIGGSTTECAYVSDSLTWSAQLGGDLKAILTGKLWLNNAGLDGTTTSGHIILLRDHIIRLHPKYVIFLIGVNDTEEKGMQHFDLYNSDMLDWTSPREWLRSLLKKTEIGSLAENLFRAYRAGEKRLMHDIIDFTKEPHYHNDEATIAKTMASQALYLKGYRSRVLTLDSICRANNITPIFLTQPTLFASFTDPTTGVDFTDFEALKHRSAMLQGKVLDAYNKELLDLKNTNGLIVVNLEAAMPHDSRYYYDYIHFTPIGNQLLARIVADSVRQYIR